MFPSALWIWLSEPRTQRDIDEVMRGWFPALHVGETADLLKASSEWPDVVVEVRTIPEDKGPEGFVCRLVFHRFPERPVQEAMRPVKLELMRRLARHFECAALADAREYRDGEMWRHEEVFLCRGGRVFPTPLHWNRIGRFEQVAWEALDDLPCCELDASGRLRRRAATVAAYARWCAGRPEPVDDEEEKRPPGEEEAAEWEEEAPLALPWEGPDDSLDPYLERLSQWEEGHGTTASKILISAGTSLPTPEALDDRKVHDKLWEVIHALARQQIYLDSTNHLSDRQLYAELWSTLLNEDIMDLSGIAGAACHFDLLGSGSEEDNAMRLVYYDDAEDRASWWASFPDTEIPAHRNPPYDRDRFLPRGPIPPGPDASVAEEGAI